MEKAKIQSFTDLGVWKEGHKLVLMVYRATRSFPKEEIFGLTSQLRRAVVSVTSNIAEGFSRSSLKEKMQFYFIAKGSLTETQSQLLIARDVGYLEEGPFKELSDQVIRVGKILTGLMRATRNLIM